MTNMSLGPHLNFALGHKDNGIVIKVALFFFEMGELSHNTKLQLLLKTVLSLKSYKLNLRVEVARPA